MRGTFEQWQRVLGGILQCAGIEGFCENAAEHAASSPIKDESAARFRALRDAFHDTEFTAKEANAVDGIAKMWGADSVIGLGRMLASRKDSIAGGLVLRYSKRHSESAGYLIEEIKARHT